MSTAGLFGDDSSDEEEEAKFDENTSNPTTTPAAKTAPSFKEEGNALNDSDEEVGTKAVDKKKPSTADLFGEDSDDDDDEEGDDERTANQKATQPRKQAMPPLLHRPRRNPQLVSFLETIVMMMKMKVKPN